MNIEHADALWLDERAEITLGELVELSGLPQDVLIQLVECGVLVPAEPSAAWHFRVECISTVRTAKRMHDDFELDANGLALAVRLLERIRELESQLQKSRAAR